VGTKFFSHRIPGRTWDARRRVGSEPGLEGGDHQQALVLGVLRRAAGAPVSYAELRGAGVELPASVVSELELAGVAIERCFEGGGVGVRLDPANDPAAQPASDPAERPTRRDTEAEPTWSPVRIYRPSGLRGVQGRPSRPADKGNNLELRRAPGQRRGTAVRPAPDIRLRANPRGRVLALTALLAGIVVVSFVALRASGGNQEPRAPIAKRAHPRVVVAADGAHPARRAPLPTHPPSPAPVSPALATELEAHGHSLLEAGQYGDAVPVLKRAVLATGKNLGACLEPASSTCLTYAYALYDLGRAVRLSGEPREAVAILERRLQIDNQRSVVVAELQLAREGIG
jgi:hypothetical protein